jgi:uncharacterized protein YkwD
MGFTTRIRATGLALALAAIAIGATFGLTAATRSASALSNCSVADNTFDAQESAFLGLINNYRAQNGLAALSLSTNLNRSSSWLAVDMPAKNYFSHTDSLGRDPSTRAQNCGYPSGAGENIAAGTNWSTAQQAFDAWRNSAGHNANMLNSSYKQIGIARYFGSGSTYGWYWVTDFGLVNDGTSGTGSGTGTGTTTTPTPPPPPPATVNTPASISSPASGSTLPGSSASFTWTAGSGALEYFFYAGSTPGANNYYGQSAGLNRSVSIANLPADGSTVYVRLWTRFASGWQWADYTYRAASSGGSTVAAKAALTSPAPGSVLNAGANTFSWTAGSGAREYFLYLGTAPGANNLFGQSVGLNRAATINVPAHSGTLYARLWTLLPTGWQFTDYTYR